MRPRVRPIITDSLTRQASSNTPTLLVPAAYLTWPSGLPIIPNNGVPHPPGPGRLTSIDVRRTAVFLLSQENFPIGDVTCGKPSSQSKYTDFMAAKQTPFPLFILTEMYGILGQELSQVPKGHRSPTSSCSD
ncbi:hypothetical protein CFIO01_13409 [Colletotrichum fioriniae PJ7]|uniref:Uncharacterized protein n=1 Tax=Colletotrichum fioriniae PJ7 TaxID=1445577 RepID=A0A010RFS0_9PEZI|nr:hypothetical protein CFIO01_13409 [Colletotrichum fioriniae PJ7]